MRFVSVVCASLGLLGARTSAAQVDEEALELMRETVSYTDVADAADGRDPFDLNVNLSYERVRDRASLYREHALADGTRTQQKVAHSHHEVSRLALGLDVGLLRDLMATARLPLVLSDARTLDAVEGARAFTTAGPGDEVPMFDLPFASPRRAGLDYLAMGAAWAVLNQMRTPWNPTWVLRIEGRRAIGTSLRAACQDAGSACAPEKVDRRAGSSRGMSGLAAETRFSRRYRYVEPYAGLSFLMEWPALGNDAARRRFRTSDGEGRAGRPGPESGATLGAAIVPWEERGSFQRIAVDVRLTAVHVARGIDYSPLFDALGSSSHPALATPRFTSVRGSLPGADPRAACSGPDDVDCGEGPVPFTGVTQVDAHLRYGGQIGLEVQAARYVRFTAGTSLQWTTPHAVTGLAPCSGSGAGGLADDGRVCTSGRVDARHRAAIDAPGRRFYVRDQLLIGVYAQATAQF